MATEVCVLCLLLLFMLVRCCSSLQCKDVTTAIVEQQEHTVQVSGTFENSTLTLHCGITDGELLHGQQLIWSEGGVEIKDSLDSQYQVTRTSSVLTFPNASGYRYGEYSCRCHNRFNYTVDTIEAFIHNTSNVFSPYCSKPASIVVPQDIQVKYHNVSTPGESVFLECEDNDTVLYQVLANDSIVRRDDPMYTLSSPAHQSKFLCVLDEVLEFPEVTEVHYAIIQDYFPLQFVLPDAHSTMFTIDIFDDPTPPPLCAIVSPTAPMDGEFQFKTPFGITSSTLVSNGNLYVLTKHSTTIDAFLKGMINFTCKVRTTWETMTSKMYKIDSYSIPDFAIEAMPLPEAGIEADSDATIRCHIKGRNHNNAASGMLMVMVHFNGSDYNTQLNETFTNLHSSVEEYYAVIPSVTVESTGEYVCIAKLQVDEHCIKRSAGVYLNVISTNEELIVVMSTSTSVELSTSSILSTTSTKLEQATTSVISSSLSSISSTQVTIFGTSSDLAAVTSATVSQTVKPATPSDSRTITIIIGSVTLSATVMICMLMTVIIVIYVRKWKHIFTKGQRSSSVGDDFDIDAISLSHLSTAPSMSFQSGVMFKFLQERLILSKWYVSYDKLQVHEVLGSGAFGMVKRATGYGIVEGEKQTIAAVKMLKAYATEEEQRDIITEFNMLQRVGTHKNIVNLIGASSYNGQLVVIVEYCPGGSLLSYLRKSRTHTKALSLDHQLNMALQVAEGMEYLAAKQCIHRDLAARNILITGKGTLKVADFGLAREMYHSVYKQMSKSKVPFKWMSPESIFDSIYTVKSDVWSFGVLLWEIATLGQLPYPGKTIEQLKETLKAHMVMEKYEHIPSELYELMLQCWKFEPNERPSFTELLNIIQSQATVVVENCVGEVSDCSKKEGYECHEEGSDGADNDTDSINIFVTRPSLLYPRDTHPPLAESPSELRHESYRTGSSDSGIMNDSPRCQVLWHNSPDDLDYIPSTVINA